jgi:hypothetical protein
MVVKEVTMVWTCISLRGDTNCIQNFHRETLKVGTWKAEKMEGYQGDRL